MARRATASWSDAPRPPSTPILLDAGCSCGWSSRASRWPSITLGVISWATAIYGEAVARTMGLTAFSLTNIWFALETSDEDSSLFSPSILANPTLLKWPVSRSSPPS